MSVGLIHKSVEMLLSLLSVTVASRKFMDFISEFDGGMHMIHCGGEVCKFVLSVCQN